jgi:hypothetical protein
MRYLDAIKARKGPAENKALDGPALNKAEAEAPDALGSVTFASPRAREDAVGRGLTATSFEGVEPSSERGYTTADVRSVSA